MPFTLRPREKLFAQGAKNLSDAELIAILLGTGSTKQNALILGDKLLKEFPLKKLDGQLKEMIRYPGVGTAKAARIAAALELGERLFSPTSVSKIIIRNAQDVLTQVRDIAKKRQEYLLNGRDILIVISNEEVLKMFFVYGILTIR